MVSVYLGTAKFIYSFKKFGCNGGSICVGNTGCRLGREVFWNTKLNIFMTNK
jgi:hypothetical protein